MSRKSQKKPEPIDRYEEYVEHPRYGRGPRYTGLDVDPCDLLNIHLHWINGPPSEKFLDQLKEHLGRRPFYHDDGTRMIPGTAVAAHVSKQVDKSMPSGTRSGGSSGCDTMLDQPKIISFPGLRC